MFRRIVIGLFLAPALAHPASWESFELGTTQWTSSDAGGRLDARISRDVASEGTHSFGGRVEIKTLEGDPKAGFFLQPDADFSKIDAFHFDIYVGTTASWTGKLIFQTGPSWDWNEMDLGELKPGWNKGLGCDFRTQLFNKDKPMKLQHPELISKIQILLSPTQATQGGLYLDNLQLEGSGAEAMAPKRLPGTKEYLVNDFEGRDSGWKAVSDAAQKVEPDNEFYSRGQQGLRLVTFSKNPDQTAIFGMEHDFNLSSVQSMVVDVYNPGGHSLLSLGIAYGPNWDYAESPSNKIKPGWNYNVTFDFQSKNFKSAASNWKNTMALPDLSTVRRVSLVYSPGQYGQGGIVIDNLRVRAQSEQAALPFRAPGDTKGLVTAWEGPSGLARPKTDFSDATDVGLSSTFVSGDSESLRLGYKFRSSSSAATYELLKPIDLLGVRAAQMDVYNPSDSPVDLDMAFQIGDDLQWYESGATRLSPGWNEGVQIKLDGPVFKSASSQWASSVELPSRTASDIKTAFLQINQAPIGEGDLYVANMSLVRRPDLAALGIPATINGGYQMDLTMDTAQYTLWDTGYSEGGFEKGVDAWVGSNGAGSSLAVIQQSSQYTSQGKFSLRADLRASSTNPLSALVTYNPSTKPGRSIPDLSTVSRIRLDIFNAGPPLGFSMAFATGSSGQLWYQSLTVPLKPGWNRDLTVDLDAPQWKIINSAAGAVNPALNTFEFPKSLRVKGAITSLNLVFQSIKAGSVYIDNIRLGKPGSSTDLGGEANLGLHVFAGRNVELEMAGTAGKSQDGSAWVLPGMSRLKVKGDDQELSLSFGAPLQPFDDAMTIFTGRVGMSTGYASSLVGSATASMANTNLAALQYSGSFMGLQVQGFSAVPWDLGLYSPGDELLSGIRAKAPLGSWAAFGGSFISDRFGYDPDANYLTDKAEQDIQVGELDAALHLPLGINLSGGYGQTAYALDNTLYILKDSQGLPQLYTDTPSQDRTGWMVHGDASHSAFTVSAEYWDVGAGFDTALSDTIYNATKSDSKLITKFEGFDAIRLAGLGDSWGKALIHGMSLTLEYATFDKSDGTYSGGTSTLRFENAAAEKLGYILSYAVVNENSAAVGSAPSSDQKQDELALVRATPWTDGRISVGVRNTPYLDIGSGDVFAQTVTGIQASQRISKKAQFNAALGYFNIGPVSDDMTYTNVSCGLDYAYSPWLNGSLNFGQPPFADSVLGMNWLIMDPRLNFTVKGNF